METKLAIVKLLKRAQHQQILETKLADAGIEITLKGQPEDSYLDIALDLMGVPEDNWYACVESEITPDQFCRDWLMRQFWDEVESGKFNPSEYMKWVYHEIHKPENQPTT